MFCLHVCTCTVCGRSEWGTGSPGAGVKDDVNCRSWELNQLLFCKSNRRSWPLNHLSSTRSISKSYLSMCSNHVCGHGWAPVQKETRGGSRVTPSHNEPGLTLVSLFWPNRLASKSLIFKPKIWSLCSSTPPVPVEGTGWQGMHFYGGDGNQALILTLYTKLFDTEKSPSQSWT